MNFTQYDQIIDDDLLNDFGSEDDDCEAGYEEDSDEEYESEDDEGGARFEDEDDDEEDDKWESEKLKNKLINHLNSKPKDVSAECLAQWNKLGPFSDLDLIQHRS